MRNPAFGQLIKEVLAFDRNCMFVNVCKFTSLVHTATLLFKVHFNITFFSSRNLSIPIHIRLS